MKSPAVLWYPSDFISSTIFWSNEQCGAYIRLLNYQFTVGHLKKEQMLQITNDDVVLSKFTKDDDGLFYNKRMEDEIEKRKKYSQSRSKNKLGKTKTNKEDMKNISKSYDNHMGNENKNENIIDYFNNNIHNITNKEYEDLTKWEQIFNEDIIKEAINKAIDRNAKNIGYINAILRDWQNLNFKTLEEIRDNDKKYKSSKSYKSNQMSKPEWLDKENKDETMSEEELKELESDFNDIFGK